MPFSFSYLIDFSLIQWRIKISKAVSKHHYIKACTIDLILFLVFPNILSHVLHQLKSVFYFYVVLNVGWISLSFKWVKKPHVNVSLKNWFNIPVYKSFLLSLVISVSAQFRINHLAFHRGKLCAWLEMYWHSQKDKSLKSPLPSRVKTIHNFILTNIFWGFVIFFPNKTLLSF